MIKTLVMDIDGTLTDGKIYMGVSGELMKAFSIKDGYGIHDVLPEYGIIPIVITGRSSSITENRCQELGISKLYQGVQDKSGQLNIILRELKFSMSEVAYIGDDLNDYSCMQMIKSSGGIIACPNNAVQKVKDIADFISTYNGGDGAVREFIEWIIEKAKA